MIHLTDSVRTSVLLAYAYTQSVYVKLNERSYHRNVACYIGSSIQLLDPGTLDRYPMDIACYPGYVLDRYPMDIAWYACYMPTGMKNTYCLLCLQYMIRVTHVT